MIHLVSPTPPPPLKMKKKKNGFTFSWLLQWSQEKLRTMLMEIFWGKQGVLWKMEMENRSLKENDILVRVAP